MENINWEQERESFEKQLKKQLHQHRERLNLRISEVAQKLCIGYSTYQRWESTGKRLTNVHNLLGVCRVLKFSTDEVIDLLGLPPIKWSEIKDIPLELDKDTLNCIKENGICYYMRKNCADMSDTMIEQLLDIIYAERLKRNQK